MISYIPIPYSLLKIKPDSRLTGNTYSSIIKALYSTRRPLKERVSHTNTSKYNGDIHLQMVNPITYEIMFDGDNKKTTPTFCFGVPGDVSQYIKQRIQGILPQSTLTFEEDYSNMFLQSYMYEYKYTKDNMLSLKTGENNFLQSILDLKNTILKGEKILFQIQMLPIGDTWKTFNDDKWDKVRDGKDVTVKGKAAERFFDGIYKQVQDILQVCDSIMGCEIKDDKKIESSKIGVSQFSTSSRNKKSDDGFMTTIHLFVKCKDKLRANMYATTVETSLRELEEDNRLVCGKGKLIDKVKRGLSIKGKFLGNIMSGKELASLVNIPNQKLQREFKIDSINMRQINAPKECVDSGSGIRLGTLEIHGETKPIYMPKDRDILAMPYWLLCGMGGGKTTALLNRANDIVMAKQGLIDINYTSKCELAYAIKDIHKDHIIINMADIDNIPAFMFPEVKIYDTDTPHDRKRKAGNCGNEIEYFINCVTCDTSEKFTTRMGQYLICAAKIVFIYNGMRVKTVFDILEDKNIRDIWIKKAIDCGVYKEDDYEIRKLRFLDDDSKGTLTNGILDRFSVLMRDTTIQAMLDGENPMFNFIDIMDMGKSISICMPEDDFTDKRTKDIIIAYIMCRVRLAMLSRKDRNRVCHIMLDEAHHLESSLNVISHSVSEVRKYGIALCFATHYFAQLGESLKRAALNSGGHFILLKGVGESSYNELKDKIGCEWTYDDIRELEDRHSLNMILIRNQHYIFTTKMLPPLLDKNGCKYIN